MSTILNEESNEFCYVSGFYGAEDYTIGSYNMSFCQRNGMKYCLMNGESWPCYRVTPDAYQQLLADGFVLKRRLEFFEVVMKNMDVSNKIHNKLFNLSHTNKLFCIISMWAGEPSVIECADKKLWQRRGVNESPFSLSYPCFTVTPTAYKKLLADGYTEVSQEEFLSKLEKENVSC